MICVLSVYFQSAKFRTFQPVKRYQEAPAACRCLLAEKMCFRISSAMHPCGLCRCKPCRWENVFLPSGQLCRVIPADTVNLHGVDACFFNPAAHRDVIQASCSPMALKTNCTTIVFKKFCITACTRQGRSKPFLEREGFGLFVFGGVLRRTTKASAAHGRAASAQAQCTADAYFLCRALSPDGKVRGSAAF